MSPAQDLLGRVLAGTTGPFALVHRSESPVPRRVEVLTGDSVEEIGSLDEIPLADEADIGEPAAEGGDRHEVLVTVPYRQIAERGYECVDDGAPLLAMPVRDQEAVPVSDALHRLPDMPVELRHERFDVSDEDYADTVRRIIADEIGGGAGANFVLRRSYRADVDGWSRHAALALFRKLLEQESGAYWTFVVHTGARTFVGASPERHISLRDGTAVMNPISGTYRYPPSGPELSGIMSFLADRKEADELYMVLDEELKMMARVCEEGGRVLGPRFKEMARLAHTEYFIQGRSSRDVRELLRETMFAPTVVGSPLENACRIIRRYEPSGRGYYSGVLGLAGRDGAGRRAFDSSILIRTADIDEHGRMELGVGATVVRHSDPDSEVAETRAKAAGLLTALRTSGPRRFAGHSDVRGALLRRNERLSRFWLDDPAGSDQPSRTPAVGHQRVLMVDAEDTFTAMFWQLLRSLGLSVTLRRFDEDFSTADYDLVVLGPGPGDPREVDDPKIARLDAVVRTLLADRQPFLAVCLSHQVLSAALRFPLLRKEVPNQGRQADIELFGTPARVGFYNTFTAHSDVDKRECEPVSGVVAVERDTGTGEVHALRGPHFCSLQFHPESVLSEDGVRVVSALISDLLDGSAGSA